MNCISLQCSELLFADDFADNEAAEVIIFHLIATGRAGCAGLGEIPFGALESFGGRELEELVNDGLFSDVSFSFTSHFCPIYFFVLA